MRKHYLDNIRWATVLLVLIYHVFYMYNGVGVLGGIPNSESIPIFDTIASLIYPWFMVLLFVVSGMSARFSTRTDKEFIKERARKLLVPSTLGLFVIHFVTGYLNIKMGGGLSYIPKPLVYPISVISGSGPLWFIQLLFVFSCILVLIKKIRLGFCEKISTPLIFLLFILIFLSAQVLNMPVITVYRLGIYFVSFLIGYYVFSYEAVQEKIQNARIWSLCLAVIFGVWYGIKFIGTNYTTSDCLNNIITNMYLWFMVLAILGFGRKYFNKQTKYMAKASFGIYILHYPVLICMCYILDTYFNFAPILNYVIALVLQLPLTLGLYEIIKRIPIIRYLVLGMKKESLKVRN